MSGVELPLDDLTTPISEICVTDEEKQALILLDDFITEYIKRYKKNKASLKGIDIKAIESALDTLLVCIKNEKKKHAEERNKHFHEITWRAACAFRILANERVSASRYFQYVLCCYLSMKKRQEPHAHIKLKSGKIEWTIADDLVGEHDIPSFNRICQLMQEAYEMATKEGCYEVITTKIKNTLALLQKDSVCNLKEWSERFLDVMVKKLQSRGLGKVYKEGSAIFLRFGDSDYKPIRYSRALTVEGWLPHEQFLQKAIESTITNAMNETAGTPPGLKISPQITSLSDHLKKIEFIPN